jgi:hypothetical protein
MVFSVRFVAKCYKQENYEAGSWGQGEFGNAEEGERPQLKTATKQRLVETVTDWEDLVFPTVVCELCRAVTE